MNKDSDEYSIEHRNELLIIYSEKTIPAVWNLQIPLNERTKTEKKRNCGKKLKIC